MALATFFIAVQGYTSLAALAPTPPVGYVFLSRSGAAALAAALVVSAAVCLAALVRERPRLRGTASCALLCAWIGSAVLATVLGIDPLSGLQVVAMMLLGAVFHLTLVTTFARGTTARNVVLPYLACGLAANCAGVAMAAAHRPVALWALNGGRAAGLFVTANQFAAFALTFGFVALGAALALRGRARMLATAAVASALVALVATRSLGGALGALAGAAFLTAACGRRRSAGALATIAVAASAFALVRPAALHARGDELDRVRIWRAGVRAAVLFPLTGSGPMTYWRVYPSVRAPGDDPPGTFGALHPHDAYLSLAGETGVVGLAAAAYGWWRFFGAVRSGARARTARERRLLWSVCAALVAACVQGVFDTIGIVQMTFVWIPYAGLALAAAEGGLPLELRA